jgi:hypothetical protein
MPASCSDGHTDASVTGEEAVTVGDGPGVVGGGSVTVSDG